MKAQLYKYYTLTALKLGKMLSLSLFILLASGLFYQSIAGEFDLTKLSLPGMEGNTLTWSQFFETEAPVSYRQVTDRSLCYSNEKALITQDLYWICVPENQ